MPSKKQYNLVHNDENDTRIPLHSEEAFHRGIVFHAKFIGSLEVPRPTSRMEIVAAMRRIRYEFKAKGIKKKRVTLEVSVDGLKVTLRKKKKKQSWVDESKLVLMHHPIYRIFYVSHDSHDLKIFSYIARDGSNNSFRCNVFKSSKKSQAMRVVRTVGQAFEVCHKLSINGPTACGNGNQDEQQHQQPQPQHEKERLVDTSLDNQRSVDEYDDFGSFPQPQHSSPSSLRKDISLLGDAEDSILDQPCPPTSTCPASPTRQSPLGKGSIHPTPEQLVSAELTALRHEIQLLRERLEQQAQQTRAATSHARLLQEQLAAETAARVEAQARTHQLLVQNKELLEHIGALVGHLREQERVSGVPCPGGPMLQLSGANLQGPGSEHVMSSGLGQLQHQCLGPYFGYPAVPSPIGFYDSRLQAALAYANFCQIQQQQQQQLWSQRSVSPVPLSSPSSTLPPQLNHVGSPSSRLPPTGRPRPTGSTASSTTQTPNPSRTTVKLHPPNLQARSRSLERPSPILPVNFAPEATFIKPLPCHSKIGSQTQAKPKPERPQRLQRQEKIGRENQMLPSDIFLSLRSTPSLDRYSMDGYSASASFRTENSYEEEEEAVVRPESFDLVPEELSLETVTSKRRNSQ